jgi:hypothetical protein
VSYRHPTSPRGHARSPGLVAVHTLTLTLAACGGSSGSTATTATTGAISSGGSTSTSISTSGSSGGSKASTPSGSGGASAKVIKVCDVLPVADVAKLSGLPLTKAEEVDLPMPGTASIAKCSYTSADRTQQIGVTTHDAGNSDAVKKALAAEADIFSSRKVSGVGDLAYFSSAPGVGGLTVLYGSTEIKVSATQEIQQDVAVTIADALHAKL